MSETAPSLEAGTDGLSAGALLKAARQAQGLHIAALAAAIKVTPAKLEALEEDRYSALPDATFTRALAQTVCRALKIDAQPVLARLPQSAAPGLGSLGRVETPLRSTSASRRDRDAPAAWQQPMWWLAGTLVLAALVLWWWPADWGWQRLSAGGPRAQPDNAVVADTAASAPAEPVSVAAPEAAATDTVTAAAAPASSPATAAAGTEAPLLQFRLRGESWVQVQDATGRVLIARLLNAGDEPALNGTPPFKVTIGNVGATELRLRGQPVPLPGGAGAVARLELK